ncbi:MAG: hypothetical protein AB7T32_00235 [Dehalococcoidia bacterium]
MRTTLDLDPKLLEQMPELTGEATASKALNKLMAEAVRKKKLADLKEWILSGKIIGTLNDTQAEDKKRELEDMRRALN